MLGCLREFLTRGRLWCSISVRRTGASSERFLTKFGGQLMSGKMWRRNLKYHITLYVLLTAVGFLVNCISANAQTATGRVIGTVTDSQCAATAAAEVYALYLRALSISNTR